MTTTTTAIEVQVIIPVHNASATIVETVQSAMNQLIHNNNDDANQSALNNITLHVCCFDDGSTDNSWELLQSISAQVTRSKYIPATLYLQRHATSRGAGVARNRAVAMRPSSPRKNNTFQLLCWLDSDDIMLPTRVYEQVSFFMNLSSAEEQDRTLLGCHFVRDPPTATWHYTQWANTLTEERLLLEQFREVTVVQPTWMMTRCRFEQLGGYLEAESSSESPLPDHPLVDPTVDTLHTLRLAEDLRFFHQHLQHAGVLKIVQTPLVVYKHRQGLSQSSETPRKLLLHIRVLAFSHRILDNTWLPTRINPDASFCIWGAGRDGKDFLKALTPVLRSRVYCFVDVDDKKISRNYVNRDLQLNIPIVHFSLLASDSDLREQLQRAWCDGNGSIQYGRIDKGRCPATTTETTAAATIEPATKKQRLESIIDSKKLDMALLAHIPVVVCVAMYRTNGALEHNVNSIGRTEGKDLWFFS